MDRDGLVTQPKNNDYTSAAGGMEGDAALRFS